MAARIALLRGINVGGRNLVGMAELRQLLTRLGFKNVRSLLQSGNLVFDGGPADGVLEPLLEKALAERFALEIDCFVRTAAEWDEAIAANPFAEGAASAPTRLVLMALKQAPSSAQIGAVEAATTGPEEFRAAGRHAYIIYPDGIGRSRLNSNLIERKLGIRGTARNWQTVLGLAQLANS